MPLSPGAAPAGGLAVDATLRAAARRRSVGAASLPAPAGAGPAPLIEPEDLRRKIRLLPRNMLVVFLVDASDSMMARARMQSARGAVLALLERARRERHRVGLVVFRDERARVMLPPTSSVTLARSRLAFLSTGGATPLADGLRVAWELIRGERRKDPAVRPLLVLVSDGEANVPLHPLADPLAEACALGRRIRADRIRSVVIGAHDPGAAAAAGLARLAHGLGAPLQAIGPRPVSLALLRALVPAAERPDAQT